MLNGIFNMDNPFWRAMGKVADLVIINLLFIVCSIPVVTIGASYTALYTVMLKLVKNEESYIFRGFFKAFKNNLKQSTIIWLIMLVVGALLGTDLYLSKHIDMSLMKILNYIFLVFGFIYAMVLSYVFPILSKFDNSTKDTLRNALLMSIAHFPWSILIILVNLIPLIIFLFDLNIFFAAIFPILIFIGFSLMAFANSYIFNRIFKKYIPEASGDDNTEISAEESAAVIEEKES